MAQSFGVDKEGGFIYETLDRDTFLKYIQENWIKYKMPPAEIQYSEKYFDDTFEYRHVILPPDLAKLIPRTHLLTETEWRNLGVQQSPGWIHYMGHCPEPHILLFRRLKVPENNENADTQSTTTSMRTATAIVGTAAN